MHSPNRRRVLHQINVTPLVDVMLVLLIIFMVTAPMMKEGLDVALPKVEAGALNIPEEPIIITIDKTGKLFINDNPVKRDDLEDRLQEIYKRKAEKMVLLKADGSVPYKTVADAMSRIRGAGIDKVGMMTEPAMERDSARGD
ncbi:MAG: protein TolR [Deltaproteobacteria bacterium]|nr:protein TolR [Deltaproteobacteria bacterium]